MTYNFDRFLRYDEMVSWLNELAARFPQLVTLETYGKSHQGRDLWIATVTDSTTGSHDTKPAHWIDALKRCARARSTSFLELTLTA